MTSDKLAKSNGIKPHQPSKSGNEITVTNQTSPNKFSISQQFQNGITKEKTKVV